MSKKRKKVNKSINRKRDNSPENNKVLRISYLKIIQKLCKYSGCEDVFKLLTKEEQIDVFAHRIYVDPIKIIKGEDYSEEAYQFFKVYVSDFYTKHTCNILTGNKKELTNFEALVGLHFLGVIGSFHEQRKMQLFVAFSPLLEYLGDKEKALKNIFFQYSFLCNSTNMFERIVYTLRLDIRCKEYPTPGLCYEAILTSAPPRPSDYIDKGNKRKVYQLGYVRMDAVLKWVFVPVHKLKGKYNGCKKALPLCIQSHAYHRLFERLKPLKDLNVAWHFSYNLKKGVDVEFYKGRFLIPFFHWDHKCGYFVGVINQNRLIIKTFLFLTHHNTPEGEKLENISGLSKEEISYWKIDTLQNFISADLGDNQKILGYLKAAGISHLLDLNPMLMGEQDQNTYNWDALNNYIDKGKIELFDEGAEENAEELLTDFSYENEAKIE